MASRSTAASRPIADRKPSKGGAVDGRTLVARRRRELIEIYTIALGGSEAVSKGLQVGICKAAELTALAEQARAKALREGTTDRATLDALVRLENTALRATRDLNLPAPGAPASKPETLADYVARKAAQKATGGTGGAPA